MHSSKIIIGGTYVSLPCSQATSYHSYSPTTVNYPEGQKRTSPVEQTLLTFCERVQQFLWASKPGMDATSRTVLQLSAQCFFKIFKIAQLKISSSDTIISWKVTVVYHLPASYGYVIILVWLSARPESVCLCSVCDHTTMYFLEFK